jgi:peptidoglycan/LPS O-acetylase OafA/YrhL
MIIKAYQSLCGWRDKLIFHKPSAGPLLENFDGVRAVAATMVFLHHALQLEGTLGPAGVSLFFTLSGYLLYLVFLRMEVPLPNSGILLGYLVRRIFRLAPLFIAYLLFRQLFWLAIQPGAAWNFQWIAEHLLLLSADGHLWTIKTEMVFYLFLPFLILLLAPILNPGFRLVALGIIALLTWWFVEYNRLFTLDAALPVFTPFILGMMAVHVQHLVRPWVGRLLALVGILILLDFGLGHPAGAAFGVSVGVSESEVSWGSGLLAYGACTLLVLGVASFKSPLWGNSWLRLLGVVGYGFYLWHPLVITWYLYHSMPIPLLPAFLFSFAIALAGYILIERPGMRLGKQLASRVVANQLFFGIRYLSICLFGIAVLFGTRQIFVLDTDIGVRVEINTSRGVLSQVFLSSNNGYSEENSSWYIPEETGWQEITFTFPDQDVNRLRLDPGDQPGTYEVGSVEINYPYARDWVSVPLNSFQAGEGISRAEVLNGILKVETEPQYIDPMLISEGEFSQPWYRPWRIFWLVVLGGTILLGLLSRLLDRVSARYSPRLDGKQLLRV